eukprot:TRINITY_DN2073_c0_g1_i2.p1 TRINITY_DN2073_c0_g1~~TRINITY_DN2073_c0_g1_i2.p1  ORF type:complete len:229 (+),score=47.97 TRINITY_DN2073_c0_g1_i2:72-689(+)
MLYRTLFFYALSVASLFTPSWSSRVNKAQNTPLTTVEKSVIKAFHNLQLGKPDHVAAELHEIYAEAGKKWMADTVNDLQKRMDAEGYYGDNFSKLRDAHYFAEKLQEVGNDSANYRRLSAEEVSEAQRAFAARENLHILGSDFGDEVKRVRRKLFEHSAGFGLDVTKKDVQSAIGAFAPVLASAGYSTQLGQHQNSYGAYNSGKK